MPYSGQYTNVCNCGIPNRMTRIVGGQETDINEYPWHVGLVNINGYNPFCGGSLISPRHVLTSAYCIQDITSPSSVEIILGEHSIDDEVVTRASVDSILIDPLFNSQLQYDFAILTLTQEATFSSQVSPICLPADLSKDYSGQVATATGWGIQDYTSTYIDYYTYYTSATEASTLQEANVTVITNQHCQSEYEYIGFSSDIGE